jgi:hypothetical protein
MAEMKKIVVRVNVLDYAPPEWDEMPLSEQLDYADGLYREIKSILDGVDFETRFVTFYLKEDTDA